MKKYLLTIAFFLSIPTHAQQACLVNICNNIERFSLSSLSYIKYSSKACSPQVLSKSEALEGKILSSESSFHQENNTNITITQKKFTQVTEVFSCQESSK